MLAYCIFQSCQTCQPHVTTNNQHYNPYRYIIQHSNKYQLSRCQILLMSSYIILDTGYFQVELLVPGVEELALQLALQLESSVCYFGYVVLVYSVSGRKLRGRNFASFVYSTWELRVFQATRSEHTRKTSLRVLPNVLFSHLHLYQPGKVIKISRMRTESTDMKRKEKHFLTD